MKCGAAGYPKDWANPKMIWRKKKMKSYFEVPGPAFATGGKPIIGRCLEHLFDFLASRPLPTVVSQWQQRLAIGSTVFEEMSRDHLGKFDSGNGAKSALDMLDLKGITDAVNGFVRIPFRPNAWLDAAIGASHPFMKRTYHGVKLQGLYSILYHGNLTPSRETEERGGGTIGTGPSEVVGG